jgi:hypothetical protein
MRQVADYSEMNYAGRGALLLLGGVVMGAVVGLLTAPRSGERTRRQLFRTAEAAKDQAAEVFDSVTEKLEDLRNGVTQKIDVGKKYLETKRPGFFSRPPRLTNPLHRLINTLRG